MAVSTESLEGFLLRLRPQTFPQECFLGFLHVLISGALVDDMGASLSWPKLARFGFCFEKVRWDPTMVRQMGIDPAVLPPGIVKGSGIRPFAWQRSTH